MRLCGSMRFVWFVRFVGVVEGRNSTGDILRIYLLHVVHVASVEILFVQPEKNIEVRRHRADFRFIAVFNPCLLKLALRFLLIKLQL